MIPGAPEVSLTAEDFTFRAFSGDFGESTCAETLKLISAVANIKKYFISI
jgi:hypothetical protein